MKWDNLTMSERSELMKLYLKNGITSLSAMKEHYNSFATGGPKVHKFQNGGPDDDKYSFLRREPEVAVADNTRVALPPNPIELAQTRAEYEAQQRQAAMIRAAQNQPQLRADNNPKSYVERERDANRRQFNQNVAAIQEQSFANQGRPNTGYTQKAVEMAPKVVEAVKSYIDRPIEEIVGSELNSAANIVNTGVQFFTPVGSIVMAQEANKNINDGEYGRATINGLLSLVAPLSFGYGRGATNGFQIEEPTILDRLKTNIDSLRQIRKGNSPEFGNSMFRRIDDAAYKDLQQTGTIRPNPEGVFAREGHIQSGTWWSSDGATGGGRIKYPGRKVIEISEHHPQFPTRTTPGTESLGYRVGDIQIDAYSPYIRVHESGPTGKLIPKSSYTPQLTFKDYWSANTVNKLKHPFNAEATRLLFNRGVQNYGKLMTPEELTTLMENVRNLRLANNSSLKYYNVGDDFYFAPNTLDEWSILHELGHRFDIDNKFSTKLRSTFPVEYTYRGDDITQSLRELWADQFATKQTSHLPYDYSIDESLKARIDLVRALATK